MRSKIYGEFYHGIVDIANEGRHIRFYPAIELFFVEINMLYYDSVIITLFTLA